MDRLIRMLIGPALRSGLNWYAKRGDGATADPIQRQARADTAKKMNQSLRILRRFGRF